MTTKIGLEENRTRLAGAGVIKGRSQAFDEGYNAGFEAGKRFAEAQLKIDKND